MVSRVVDFVSAFRFRLVRVGEYATKRGLFGGDEGDRTPDLGIANAALSHLSYIPTTFLH